MEFDTPMEYIVLTDPEDNFSIEEIYSLLVQMEESDRVEEQERGEGTGPAGEEDNSVVPGAVPMQDEHLESALDDENNSQRFESTGEFIHGEGNFTDNKVRNCSNKVY